MVHLVEDHEGTGVLGEATVDGCLDRHLRVRHRDAVVVPRGSTVAVAEAGVEAERDAGRGIGFTGPEVLGRSYDDAVDHAAAEQLGRQPQRERGLAGARGRRGEEVAQPLPTPSGPSAPKYWSSASACQARSRCAVPHGARWGKEGDRCSAAKLPKCSRWSPSTSDHPKPRHRHAPRRRRPLSGRCRRGGVASTTATSRGESWTPATIRPTTTAPLRPQRQRPSVVRCMVAIKDLHHRRHR